MSSKVVQVTNIAPQATKDQMQNLFGCIGKIDEIRLYPTVRDVTCPVLSRICYVKFFDSSATATALHLTNTVFIDRALIVCPVSNGVIPDEFKALEMTNNGSTIPGLPTNDSKLPPEVVNRIEGMHPFQAIKTIDPKLEEWDLPEYPPLPVNFDARKIEEIRRTIIVIDIPADWELDEILTHFAQAGEVKFARFAEKSRQKHVMIEFVEQKSIIEALKMQGTEFLGKKLNIFHSMQAIIKPEAKSNEAAQREIEEAMSIVKETQNLISAAIDPVIGILSSKDKPPSVTRRTRSRTRTRSRSHSRRSRSRKRSRRSRSRSHSRRKRSRSRSKRSRSKRRSTSRSRSKRSRSKRPRSRSRDRRKRSRSRRRSRSTSRRRSRTRSRERRKSRSPHLSRHKSSRKDEKRRRSKTRSKSRDRRRRETSKGRSSHVKESSATAAVVTNANSSSSSSSKHRDKDKDKERDKEKDRERTRDKDREKDKERGRDRDRDREREEKEREKEKVREKERERRERSRSKESSRKTKRISEEKAIRERDYDEEEKIGTDEAKRDSSEEPSPEKSDNMDISNSP